MSDTDGDYAGLARRAAMNSHSVKDKEEALILASLAQAYALLDVAAALRGE